MVMAHVLDERSHSLEAGEHSPTSVPSAKSGVSWGAPGRLVSVGWLSK